MKISLRLLLLSGLCLGSLAPRVQACASLADMPVQIADENAIIVWDAKAHTEHFIRRATFNTKAKDVGFLVPTPNTPQLAKADDVAFSHLENMMAPERIDRTKNGFDFTPLILKGFGGSGEDEEITRTTANRATTTSTAKDVSDAVEVVATRRIAGYDATVLKASDVRALNTWLKRHGYVSSPALMEWLQPYIAKKWKITAFKIARSEKDAPVASAAVRMSFKTAAPFFPYREPKKANPKESSYRLLRVFFLSNERMKGNLGSSNGAMWARVEQPDMPFTQPIRVAWASEITDFSNAQLAEQLALKSDVFAARPWMTVFEDNSSPRPSREDVVFSPSKDRSRILPKPIIEREDNRVALPADALLLALCGGIWLGVTITKRRK